MCLNKTTDGPTILRVVFLQTAMLLVLAGCAPWYQTYGIESENELYQPTSVPVLVRALDDANSRTRALAAIALGKIGAGAIDAIPALLKAVDDPEVIVRRRAEAALKDIALSDERACREAMVVFMQALENQDARTRIQGIQTLHKIGLTFEALREQVVTRLKEAMVDDSSAASLAALRAVNEFDPGSDEAIPIFKNLLSDWNASVRRYTVLELEKCKYPEQLFFPFLDHMANYDPRSTVRRDALIQLKRYDASNHKDGAAAKKSYRMIAEGDRGYVQFDLIFAGKKWPLRAYAKKWVETHIVLPQMQMGQPIAERPGIYRYSIYLADNDPLDIEVDIRQGMLTTCQVNVSEPLSFESKSVTQIVTKYFFEASVSSKEPVVFSPE